MAGFIGFIEFGVFTETLGVYTEIPGVFTEMAGVSTEMAGVPTASLDLPCAFLWLDLESTRSRSFGLAFVSLSEFSQSFALLSESLVWIS